jgi:hypothetical protein
MICEIPTSGTEDFNLLGCNAVLHEVTSQETEIHNSALKHLLNTSARLMAETVITGITFTFTFNMHCFKVST